MDTALFLGLVALALAGVTLWYWLFVITEGAYFGRRLVVWLYDRAAESYDRIKRYTLDEERVLVVEPVLGELRGVTRPLVLDVASGTGRVPHFMLADGRFGGRIVALEPSRQMLAHGRANTAAWRERVDWVQQTAVPLPFADDTFDLVISLEALEFMPSLEAAVREMVRVLKPGGALFITRRAGWEARTFVGRYYSRARLLALLNELGLADAVIVDWQNNYDLAVSVKSANG